MEIVRIATKKLLPNAGQIEGLPSNPRQWTQSDIDQIAKSLKETPELFEMRPCIVTPCEDKFVILGGNLRHQGALKNKEKDVPCIIVPADTPIAKMKEIVIKDNGSFGAWDYDMLANEWDDQPLTDWGVPAWNTSADEEEPTDLDAENKAKPYVLKITFPTADAQTAFVMAYKDIIEKDYGCTMSQSGGEL